jgi:hypothetical protein
MKVPMDKQVLRFLLGTLAAVAVCSPVLAQVRATPDQALRDHNPRLSEFSVIEFRRYVIKERQRKAFTQYFDTYFPEAFQQLGTLICGSLLERENQSGFIWIRGFHTLDDRAVLNGEFYFGSVWNEHRDRMNELIASADNVLLLRPLDAERGVPILSAVDPVKEPNGAQGVVVAQIFAVKPDMVEDFARKAETTFTQYRASGAREAGILVTLDIKNNFPQMPFRSDGPFLVWLGVLRDTQVLEKDFLPVAERSLLSLSATGLLRDKPELIVSDPSPRSRLRWLP